MRAARQLRSNSTDAEAVLWQHLRGRRLLGWKFRRQHRIGRFVADFTCLEAHLVIEADGGQHFTASGAQADADRTSELRAAGFTVLRFDNRQVLSETSAVLQSILDWLGGQRPHPDPLPQAGEGGSP